MSLLVKPDDAALPQGSTGPAVSLESALSASGPAGPQQRSPSSLTGRWPYGLRTGLLLMLAIGLLPAIAGTAWYLRQLRDIAVQDAFEQAIVVAGGTSERLRWMLQDAQGMLAAVAARPKVQAMDGDGCDSIFDDFRDLSPAFKALSLRRLDGSSVCSELAQPPSQQSVAAAAWFQAALRQPGFHASDVHLGAVQSTWTVRLTHPVTGRDGRVAGLLITPVNLQQLQQRLFANVPGSTVSAVLDASNKVVVRSTLQDERVGKVGAEGVVREMTELRRQRAAAGTAAPLTRTFVEVGIEGDRRLFAIHSVPFTQWGVVTALDERDTLHGYHQSRRRALAAIVGVLLLVGFAAWRVSRGILVPIEGLAHAARGVAAGDNSRRAPSSGPREIREVAREFNRMVVATDESAQRLRASESHYRTLIQNLPVAVVSHLPDTSIEVFNHRACSLLRMTHEQMQGRKAVDRSWYFVDTRGERLLPQAYPVNRVLQSQRPMQAEVIGIVGAGDAIEPVPHTWVMVTAYPQFDAHGSLLRVIVVFVDVTTQRHNEELRVAKETAEAASKAKTAFLSRVSHELRTPLNAINGFSELMLTDPAAPPATQSGAKHILNAGRHLLTLINQILDLTRIESGQSHPAVKALALRPLLQDCLAICAPLAEARGVSLQLTEATAPEGAATPCDETVLGDQTHLRQIMINLVSNGIKYNRPAGRVTLRVTAGDAQHPGVCVEVADTGTGLTPVQIGQLFEPFNRLGAENSAIEGHGLGLAISRALALAMGGDITVESDPGLGSRFTVRLRAAPATATQSPAKATA